MTRIDSDRCLDVSEPPACTRIDQLKAEERCLVIYWADGHRSRFHHMWLRDNCSCKACGNKSGGHRYLALNDIASRVTPSTIEIDRRGELVLTWAGDGHRTRYAPRWLRSHCYSPEARAPRHHQQRLWDASIAERLTKYSYREVRANEETRHTMFEALHDEGFALLGEVPVESDEIERLAGVFGYIRQTHYGRIFDLISTPEQRILANTSHAIRPHHDELFRDPPPGLLMMHCLRPSDDGGGASVLVDGFNAATTLAARNPEAFELLTRVPVRHQRYLVDDTDDVALAAYWRTIELDFSGALKAVHLNERTMAPLEVSEDEVEATYVALQELFALVYDPDNWLQIRLEAGDAVVLDNHRVMHARTGFAGHRHLRQCHVDRDEFLSRLRALRRRIDPDSNEWTRTEFVPSTTRVPKRC